MNITSDTLLKFTRHNNKTYLDSEWNRRILITEALLSYADPDVIKVEGERITFTVEGAQAIYRLTEPRNENPNHVYEARLVQYRGQALKVPA